MGLDTVELVMAIEDAFGIEIPDADAEHLSVLGNFCDYIVARLRSRGETPDEAEVWEKLKQIVIEQSGVRPEEVTREADIVRDLGMD